MNAAKKILSGSFRGLMVAGSTAIAASAGAAVVDTRTDASNGGAVVDGTLGAHEYGPGNSYAYSGAGTGFGGMLSGGPRFYFNSDATNLYIGFQPGVTFASNTNIVVLYLDTKSGGFTDATMNDTADAGRNVVTNLGSAGNDGFPFDADYAVMFGQTFCVVFELTGGSLNVVTATTSGCGATPNFREVSVALSALGATGGSRTIGLFAAYCSNTNFNSNETVPPIAAINGSGNPGFTSTVNYTDHNVFVTAPSGGAGGVVISQVYGGGNNQGSLYTADFVELYNAGGAAVNFATTNYSLHYRGAALTTWTKVTINAGTIQPGGYYLIRTQNAGTSYLQVDMPAPDLATTSPDMAAGAGVLALYNAGTTVLTNSGACPPAISSGGGTLVDLIGWGTTATCSEPTSANSTANNAPGPDGRTSVFRRVCALGDADNNGSDFFVGVPNPRNTGMAASVNMTAWGGSSPSIVRAGDPTLLTVIPRLCGGGRVLEATVSVNLSAIGGSASQAFVDDGTDGDEVSGDGIYSFLATVSGATTAGTKNMAATVTSASSSTGCYVSLAVSAASGPVNDSCRTAAAIAPTGTPGTSGSYGAGGVSVTGSLAGAREESNPITNGFITNGSHNSGSGGRRGLWYRVIGTGTTMTAELCATVPAFDNVLGVYCGTCDGLSVVAGGDDECGSSQARATWCSLAGQEYLVWVSHFTAGAQTNSFSLRITDNSSTCSGARPCTTCTPSIPISAAEEGETAPGHASNDGCDASTVNPSTAQTFSTIAPTGSAASLWGTSRAYGAGSTTAGTLDNDWYRFQAPASDTFQASVQAQFPVSIQLRALSGTGTCTTNTLVTSATAERCATATITALVTAGSWYAVKIAPNLPATSNNNVSGFAVGATSNLYVLTYQIGPVNDSCSAPASIASSGGTGSGSLASATLDGPGTACSATVDKDVWFSFAPTSTADWRFQTCGSAADTVLELWSACAGTVIACNDDLCGTASRFDVLGLAPGTYLLRVAHKTGGADGSFTVSIAPTPPGNDECSSPTAIFLNTPIAGTTVAATADYTITSANPPYIGVGHTSSTAPGRDVVYTFTAPSAGRYSFRVWGYSTSQNLIVYVTDTCPAPGAIPTASTLAAANRNTSNGAEEVACITLAASQQVYVFVDDISSGPNAGSAFVIEATACAMEVEGNDTPAAATPYALGASGMTGSINPGSDVDFFALGAPPAGSRIFAMTEALPGNTPDTTLRLTSATDTLEYDDDDGDVQFGASGFNSVIAGGVATGVPLYLRVAHLSGTAFEPYRLYSVVQPPSASAAAETEPNDTTGTATAIGSYISGALSSGTDIDLYAFNGYAGQMVFIAADCFPVHSGSGTGVDLSLNLLNAGGTALLPANVNGSGTTIAPGSGAGTLTSLVPAFPGEGLVYRLTATGTYFARVTGAGAGGYLLSIAAFPAPEYCSAGSAACDDGTSQLHITNVDFYGITNPSGDGSVSSCYQDFTSPSTTIQRTLAYNITVTAAHDLVGNEATVWFDWNQDIDLTDTGEEFALTQGPVGTYSGTINVPAGATLGLTRMRVRVGNIANLPCGQTASGEVEDYTVQVQVAPTSPANDPCSSPAAVTLGTPISGSTILGTNDYTEACDSGGASSRDVWYSFTPSGAGIVTLNTCTLTPGDTVMSLYTGACGTLTLVACNDDCGGAPCGGTASCLTQSVTAQPYLLRISDKGGGFGVNFTLASSFAAAPANDDCSSPGTVPAAGGSVAGNTLAATLDGPATACTVAVDKDVWYTWSPTAMANWRFATCGATGNTVVELWSDCPASAGTVLACNDDFGGGCGVASQFDVCLLPAGTYRIRVANRSGSGSGGAFTLVVSVAPPCNDTCATATSIAPVSITNGTNIASTAETGLPATCTGPLGTGSQQFTFFPGVWYVVNSPTAGTITADTLTAPPITPMDTKMHVFTGTCGGLTCVTANDDAQGSPFRSKVAFRVDPGVDYYILIAGFSGTTGNFVLTSTFDPTPPNDSCTTPTAITGTGAIAGTTVGATGENNTSSSAMPGCNGSYSFFDVWYAYTAPCTGTVNFDTCGALDTVLSIHSACPTLTVNNQIGTSCNDEGGTLCTPGSRITGFAVTASTTYLVRVVGKFPALPSGAFTLTYTSSILPPEPPTSAATDASGYCSGAAPASISLSVPDGSGTTLEWFTDSCGGTAVGTGNPLVIAAPLTTTTYYARWINACGSSACASVTVTVNPSPVAPTSAAADTSGYCAIAAPATITLTATGGSGDTLEWFNDACGETAVGTGNGLVIAAPGSTTTYFARWTNACGSSACTSATVTVTPSPVAPTSAASDATGYCENAAPATINLTAAGGSGDTLEWFSGSCGGTPIGTGNPLSIAAPTSTTTYLVRWTNACGSSACADVTVTVNPAPVAPTSASSSPTSYCSDSAPADITLTATGGSGDTLEWFTGSCGGTAVGTGNGLVIAAPGSTTTYFARRTNACGDSTCAAATVTVQPAPTASAGGPYSVVGTTPVAISGTASNHTSVLWTTSGTGTFANPTLLSTTYTPSLADETLGTVTLTLTANPIAPCTTLATSDTTLTITPCVTGTVVYVDDGYIGLPFGTAVNFPHDGGPGPHLIGCDAFATIQGGVNAVNAPGTVNVAAGVYAELVRVNKSVSLLGAQAGVCAKGGAPRGVETVLRPPAASSALSDVLIYLDASGITIDGFTLDGDNLVASGEAAGTEFTDVGNLVSNSSFEDWITYPFVHVRNISIRNNILRNVNDVAVQIYNDGSDPVSDGNSVTCNDFNNIGGLNMIGFGGPYNRIGVLLYDDTYANVDDNSFRSCNIGVQTGNNFRANGGPPASIDGNDLTSVESIGIWHNLHYASASDWSLAGNTASGLGNPGSVGIFVTSLDGTTTATVSNSTISGFASGMEFWNNPTANPVNVTGGSVSLCTNGILFYNSWSPGFGDGAASGLVVADIDLLNNTDAGLAILDTPGDDPGFPPRGVLTVDASGLTASGSTTGVSVSGTRARLNLHDSLTSVSGNNYGVSVAAGTARIQTTNLTGNSIAGLAVSMGAVVDAGQCAPGSDVTGLGVSTGGNSLSGYGFDAAAPHAIVNANASSDPDVHAAGNNFGAGASDSIELVLVGNGGANSDILFDQAGDPLFDTEPTGGTACVGGTFTFSALAYDITGYQWYKDAVLLVGETGPTLTINPVTLADAGSYTVVITDPCGNTTTSAPASLAVTPLPVAPASASVDSPAYCASAAPANITLTAVGGSGSTLEWFSGSCGGTPVGTGNALVIPAPLANTTYFARWTNACGSSPCASVAVSVLPDPVAPTGAAASATLYCADSAPASITLSASGGSGSTLEWFSAGCGSSPVGTGSPLVIPAPGVTTTYFARWTNTCGSSACASVTVTVQPTPTVNAGGPYIICEGGVAPLLGSSTHSSSVLWTTSGTGFFVNPASATTAYHPSPADILAGTVTLTLTAGAIAPCTGSVSSMATLTINPLPVAPTAAFTSDNNFCEGTIATIDLSATGGSGAKLAWRTGSCTGPIIGSGTPLTIPAPGSTTTYFANWVNACGASTCVSVTVTVLPNPVAPTSVGASHTVWCELSGPPSIMLTAVGGSGDTFQWFTGSCGGTLIGTGTSLPIPAPLATTTYFGRWSNTCGNSACQSVTVTVNPLPVPPTSASVDSPTYCANAAPTNISLTATGGSGDTLHWFSGSCGGTPVGTGSPLVIAAPGMTTTYFARWSNECGDSTCASVTVTVTPDPVAPTSATASDPSYCSDPVPASITLTAVGGSGDTLEWFAGTCGGTPIGTGNGFIVTPAPTVTTTYFARWVNACDQSACAGVTVNVQHAPTADAGSDTAVCADQAASLMGIAANDATTAWTSTGDGTFADASMLSTTYTPGPADILAGTVTLTLTANPIVPCATAATDSLTLTINPLPVAPTSVAADHPVFCFGTLPSITLTATDGSGTTLEWFDDSCGGTSIGTGSPLVIAAPAATTTYFARWVNPCGQSACASTTVVVNPLPADPPSASVTPALVCDSGSVTLTAPFGVGETIDWYTGSCGGTFVGTGSPLMTSVSGTTTFHARTRTIATGCWSTGCASTTVTVNPSPVAPTGAAASVPAFCATTPPGSITLTATGGSGDTLAWYSGSCGGTPIGTGSPLVISTPLATTTYHARWETVHCGNSACASVTVTVQPYVSVSAGGPYIACADGVASLMGSVTNGINIQWTSTGTGVFSNPASPTSTYTPSPADAIAGTVTLTLSADAIAPCTGTVSSMATLTVLPLAVPPTSASVDKPDVCPDSGTITLTATGGSGGKLHWFSSSCGGTPVGTGTPLTIPAPLATTTYFARWVNSCGPSACVSVTVNFHPAPAAPASVTSSQTEWCEGSGPTHITLTGLGGSGDTFQWFAGSCGGTPIGTGVNLTIPAPTSTTTYYGRWASGFCGESACAQVTVTVDPLPVAPTAANVDNDNFCATTVPNITLTATGGSGDVLRWYTGSCGGVLIGSGSPLVIAAPSGTTTYHARWETTSCGASTCASVTVTVLPLAEPPTSLMTSDDNYCSTSVSSITLTAFGGSGDTLEWFDDSCGGNLIGSGSPLNITAPLVTTTYFARWVNSCGPSACASLTVTVNPVTGACCSSWGTMKMCNVVPPSMCNPTPTPDGAYRGDCTTCVPTTCCPADYNNNGTVSVQDIFDFLADFFDPGMPATADFNHSGAIGPQDIFDFLAFYFAGC